MDYKNEIEKKINEIKEKRKDRMFKIEDVYTKHEPHIRKLKGLIFIHKQTNGKMGVSLAEITRHIKSVYQGGGRKFNEETFQKFLRDDYPRTKYYGYYNRIIIGCLIETYIDNLAGVLPIENIMKNYYEAEDITSEVIQKEIQKEKNKCKQEIAKARRIIKHKCAKVYKDDKGNII
ncbi:MAG: hypothetical protein ACOWWR_13590 [Eubacteriales bacterium]